MLRADRWNVPGQQDAILSSLERAQLYVDQASQHSVDMAREEQAGGLWPGFMPAFLDKGRQRDLVSRIPVKLVRCPHFLVLI